MHKAMKVTLAVATVVGIAVAGAGVFYSRPFAANRASAAAVALQAAPGWPAGTAADLQRLAEDRGAEAIVALDGDKVIARWGEVNTRYNVASVRKSVISALYGIAADRKLVNLDATLEQVGIDESRTPLTAVEKSATVRDLLRARSGVYLPTSGESPSMVRRKPARGAHRPGEYFYYNNWDFNVLGTIFERATGMSLGNAFDQWIARPTGMTGFTAGDVTYSNEGNSDYRMYRFYLGAEDLARFGALYVNDGRWGTQQVIPAAWITETLQPYSKVTYSDSYDGYGYLWWLNSTTGNAYADGSGGQKILINRATRRTIVVLNDTGRSPLGGLYYRQFGTEVPADTADLADTILTKHQPATTKVS